MNAFRTGRLELSHHGPDDEAGEQVDARPERAVEDVQAVEQPRPVDEDRDEEDRKRERREREVRERHEALALLPGCLDGDGLAHGADHRPHAGGA